MVNCTTNKFDMAYFLRLIKAKADESSLLLHSEEFVKCVNKMFANFFQSFASRFVK